MTAAFLAYMPLFACTGATVSATTEAGMFGFLNQLLQEFRI
jgi:hypothetical protein